MSTKRYIFDILKRPIREHYIKRQKELYSDIDEIRTIQHIIERRNGIREGLDNLYKRRTYHRETVDTDEHNFKKKLIANANQIEGRIIRSETHYYCDEHGGNEVIPFVIQLPSRSEYRPRLKKRVWSEIWIYGYKYSEWDGAVIVLSYCVEKDDAMREAERYAERHAEECYDDHLECVKENEDESEGVHAG